MKLCVILLAFAAIFSKVTFAKYYGKDLLSQLKDEEVFKRNGVPGTSQTGQGQDRCMKDIIIIVDASKSIGRQNFDKVKKFLKDLVHDQVLNVSPEGTNVAFMVFSSKDRASTKIIQGFDHEYDESSLNSIIDRYEWNKNGYTRTDLALDIANQMFNKRSPLNHRKDIDDVVLLMTDGEPYSESGSLDVLKQTTIQKAEVLKNKGIKIIGVGIGESINLKTLEDVNSGPESPIYVASFDGLESIKERLTEKSCLKPAGTCTCTAVDLGDWIIETDSSSRQVTWDIPKPECTDSSMKVTLQTTKPDVKPGAMFPIGPQNIKYTYMVGGRNPTSVTCEVSFEVKACKCPREESRVVPVKPGDTKVRHTWQVPVPSCLRCPSPMTSQFLSVGRHSIAYEYNVGKQFKKTCRVNFRVTGKLCKGNGYDPKSQECCCGVIHEKKPGYKCCASDYFNTAAHHCCGGNIQSNDEECLTSN